MPKTKGAKNKQPYERKDAYDILDEIRVELLELSWDLPRAATPKKKALLEKRQLFLLRKQERTLKDLEPIK